MSEVGFNNITNTIIHSLVSQVAILEKMVGTKKIKVINTDGTIEEKDDPTSLAVRLAELEKMGGKEEIDVPGMPVYEGPGPLPSNFKTLRNMVMLLAQNDMQRIKDNNDITTEIVRQSTVINEINLKLAKLEN